MRHYQADKHIHRGNPSRRREREGTEGLCEHIMARNFPHLMKDININIQKVQQIPNMINSETHTKT